MTVHAGENRIILCFVLLVAADSIYQIYLIAHAVRSSIWSSGVYHDHICNNQSSSKRSFHIWSEYLQELSWNQFISTKLHLTENDVSLCTQSYISQGKWRRRKLTFFPSGLLSPDYALIGVFFWRKYHVGHTINVNFLQFRLHTFPWLFLFILKWY